MKLGAKVRAQAPEDELKSIWKHQNIEAKPPPEPTIASIIIPASRSCVLKHSI